jgi:hypothetical protein
MRGSLNPRDPVTSMRFDDGRSSIWSMPLSTEELADWRRHPDTFFGIVSTASESHHLLHSAQTAILLATKRHVRSWESPNRKPSRNYCISAQLNPLFDGPASFPTRHDILVSMDGGKHGQTPR